jgi:hypothetical protein
LLYEFYYKGKILKGISRPEFLQLVQPHDYIFAKQIYSQIYSWQRFNPYEICSGWKCNGRHPDVIAFINYKPVCIVGFQIYSTIDYKPFEIKYE